MVELMMGWKFSVVGLALMHMNVIIMLGIVLGSIMELKIVLECVKL
jgi:hypothetical protein